MKVLFVGEGSHDIGRSDSDSHQPSIAAGTIATLARKICPNISDDSIALRWRDIKLLPAGRKKGLDHKVKAVAARAQRNLKCSGVICVTDSDGRANRLEEMERGRTETQSAFPLVCGLAIESIEAWTLGAPSAIAAVLELDPASVQQQYPAKDVEELSVGSGKPEHCSKALLQRLAGLKHQEDSTDFREAIAEVTSIKELERNCPKGFKPFAEKLRAAFGSSPQSP